MITMLFDKIVEHIQSVILVVKDFYYLEELLQLKVLFARDLGELHQDALPGLEPGQFCVI